MPEPAPLRVLYASRAFESPPNEGGFVLLRDLAGAVGARPGFDTAFFAARDAPAATPRLLRTYRGSGWSRWNALAYLRGLLAHQAAFDIVHAAHMPTPLNAALMRLAVARGRRRGVRYVQTVTALPGPAHTLDLRRLLWGDAIICLRECLREVLAAVHPRVWVHTPLPSPARLGAAAGPVPGADRAAGPRVVLYPFHFMHLPPAFPLERITRELLERRPDVEVRISYRMTEAGPAHALRAALPAALRERCAVFSAQRDVLRHVAGAALLLYPMHEAPRKFNPPLLVLEALALGCPVLASAAVDAPDAFRSARLRCIAGNDAAQWLAAAQALLDGAPAAPPPLPMLFDRYVDGIAASYRTLWQADELA